MKSTTEENFHKKYLPEPNSGCWLWMGFITACGYGKTAYNEVAHRRSWEIHFGRIPEGRVVCHKCDTPSCVNPGHLFLGTQSENMADMVKKGRSLRGERNHAAKLCEDDVKEILCSKVSTEQLSEEYGVSPKAISNIRKGKSWKHVARPDGFLFSRLDGYAARRSPNYKITRAA